MIHVFALIIIIGDRVLSDDVCRRTMCFRNVYECNRFINALTREESATIEPVGAYCKPLLIDPRQEGIKVY